ncbi:SLC13 family permease [Marinobacter caseinilyticus]|uniref:SLC13 family permease n=1 Tax=Marinobacter caseinilyticus TaxID=2692195 RepID=UPI00140D7E45|nr:SLC13 family permease [Marinobacter caseinilyticus]
MTAEQGIVFGVLAATLGLFAWNRWRFDVVALLALLTVAVAGLVPRDAVFAGFGHPAVITVAAVLVISQGLIQAGVVDSIAKFLGRVGHHPVAQVTTLTAIVALCSGFMNNVGALALLMPVAVWMSRQAGRSPSLLLMPLAFGSLLGGTMTLIGTPPNIIIASYRQQVAGEPFGMFDFLPVGAAITLAGLVFIALLGWRFTPCRREHSEGSDLFSVGDYITEIRLTEKSAVAGQTLHGLLKRTDSDADVVAVGLVRDKQRQLAPSTFEVLRAGDILLVQADTASLQQLLEVPGLELAEDSDDDRDSLGEGDVTLAEVVITTDSQLIGHSSNRLNLRERYGMNVIAVARQGQRLNKRVGNINFNAGDILLVQGPEDTLPDAMSALGCLPLAERGLRFGSPRRTLLATGVFAAALVIIVAGWLPAAIALVGAGVAMVLVGLITPVEAYRSIDWSIIVLLAAMIPVGQALETTGGADLIADQMFALGGNLSLAGVLGMVLIGTMLLSNIVNNAAAAIIVAPIAISLSKQLAISADPVLMAVAIGASCAFMTPIGHQSNALVMEPGGYQFGDYWRLGLPLSLLVAASAIPVILWVWT